MRPTRSSLIAVAIGALILLPGIVSHAANDAAGVPNIDYDSKVAVTSVAVQLPPGLGTVAPTRCMRWDYVDYPTTPTSPGTPPGYYCRYAMDGYPSKPADPLPRDIWIIPTVPTPDKPEVLTVDYGRPVAVTRFTHYYNHGRQSTAWVDVDILCSTDGQGFKPLSSYTNLPAEFPQTLCIDRPTPARYYKFVVKSLTKGATQLCTYEIETYYGTSIGSAHAARVVQSEPATLTVRVQSPDIALNGATMKMVGPKGALEPVSAQVPSISKGGSALVPVRFTALASGPTQIAMELYLGGRLIDRRVQTLNIEPKLKLTIDSPTASVDAPAGGEVILKGSITNTGASAASSVRVNWIGSEAKLGDLAPGKSAAFTIKIKAKPGYHDGAVVASDSSGGKTVLRRAVICAAPPAKAATSPIFTNAGSDVAVSAPVESAKNSVTSALHLMVGGQKLRVRIVARDRIAAVVPGGVFVGKLDRDPASGNLRLKTVVVPDDPNPVNPPRLDMELRFAVDKPSVMFRPHVDWFTAEHGPNLPGLTNGHNCATRMICVEKSGSTLSVIPDSDNVAWGFGPANEMCVLYQMKLAPFDPLGCGEWRLFDEAPLQVSFLLPARKGDWWDAYRYVTRDLLKFEQPRQWAMSVTQMQMFNARYLMSYPAWSEKWQSTHSFPYQDTFFNFYGTTYSLPALYSWYLATGNLDAKIKTDKVLEWLLKLQETEGPAKGGWFSQYASTGDKLVGYDQAGNRWIMPHSTGSAAKTLLWYWEASGKTNDRVLAATKAACDYMISIQRPDGGWPYAFDLTGKPVTDLSDAGQIWCTWALWKMYEFTGEQKYKTASLASKDFFKRTFMDVRRYMGYWEDVSGGAGNVTRSFESYEPAIAVLAFTDMGEGKLAAECAKDVATWTWTRVIDTRQYETCYGETTEQSTMGPAQAQVPMVAVAFHQAYSDTKDPMWSDLAGAMKAINFCGDPDQGYGMCATSGWFDPTTAVSGPPYDNIRSWITPDNRRIGEYGRGVWIEWQTSQFAWLALEWLIREGNVRAPGYVKINPINLQGTVLGTPGRVRMPEEKCDVFGVDHYDINWVGYRNDDKYALLVMNHKEKLQVLVRPHEAHLEIYTRAPRVLVGSGSDYKLVETVKNGVNYQVEIPANANALLVWDRIK